MCPACYLRAAMGGGVPRRAFRVALVVGPLLVLINQPVVLHDPAALELGKAGLTLVVPYLVATVGAVGTPCRLRCSRRRLSGRTDAEH